MDVVDWKVCRKSILVGTAMTFYYLLLANARFSWCERLQSLFAWPGLGDAQDLRSEESGFAPYCQHFFMDGIVCYFFKERILRNSSESYERNKRTLATMIGLKR